MPFKSKAQQKWAYATKQEFAAKWADETKNMKKLPEHAKPGKVAKAAPKKAAPVRKSTPKRKGK